MRLTLRTLLAYLDDILEPADSRDLGQKIEESEFASGLVHRIRSVTRKLRLGAPKLSGKGMGLDANTVAEYLDNTLPQDRVPDFEKVCLESDVHLAEVASCHQILTLVLGEPADVDPNLRERIRSLQARIEALGDEDSESTATAVPAAAVESPPIDRRAQDNDWDEAPEMPQVTPASKQLDTPRSSIRLLPVVGTLVVAFLLAMVALIAMGPLDGDHPVLGSFLGGASSTDGTSSDESDASKLAANQGRTTPTGAAPGGTQTADSTGDAVPDSNADSKTAARPGTDPEDGDRGATTTGNTFPPPPIGEDSTDTTEAGSTDSPGGIEPGTTGTEPGNADRPGGIESDTADTAEPGGAAPGKVMGDDGTATEPGDVVEPEPLARCMSNLHVLARFDPVTETWLRLTANDPIAPQQELVALPTYRPQIAFGAGIQLMLIGPAAVSLREPGADGVPGLVIHFGRVLATTDGSPNAALNIQIGDRNSRVMLPGLDSSLVLDVQRYHPPGANPEEVAAHWLIGAQAAAGQVSWQDEGAEEALLLAVGQLASMLGTDAPQVTTDSTLPEWLDAKNLRPIDRDASEQLEPLLELNRPLTTSLLEQTTNRLVEVRTLAIRSLCMLGTYDSFIVSAFNSKTYRTFWPDLLLALRIAVAQDSETATRIRTTFERLRGAEGSQLFRFLWEFSPQQLADGAAATLVKALESDSMDIRVFAYDNVNSIAEKTNSYQPEVDPGRQRRAILNWQRDLEQGEIAYKTHPFEVSD